MNRLTMAMCLHVSLLFSFAPATALAQAGAGHSTEIGVGFEVLPLGELEFEGAGLSLSSDTAVAFGVAAFVEYFVSPAFSIGFAPRFLFRIRGEDGSGSAEQLDLRARARLHTRASRAVGIYGFVAPGYSILFIPEWPGEFDRPAGLVIGFGGGLTYDIGPQGFISFELGYQLGFQKVSEQGESADVKSSFLHLGFGGGARF